VIRSSGLRFGAHVAGHVVIALSGEEVGGGNREAYHLAAVFEISEGHFCNEFCSCDAFSADRRGA